MKTPADFILSELGDIEQVMRTACLVESTVRGHPTDPHDLKVQLRAADMILSGLGEEVRSVIENNAEHSSVRKSLTATRASAPIHSK